MDKQGSRVFAGLGILAGMIALGAFVFFLDDITRAMGKPYTIVGVFPSAEGVRVGTPVWIAGHQVGSVSSIGFRPVLADSTASIAVRIELPGEHRTQVRRDSRIRLTRPQPVGEPVVDISPGSPNSAPLVEGDTLFADPPPNVKGALAGLGSLRTALDSLVLELQQLRPLAQARQRQFARLGGRLEGVQHEVARLRQAFAQGGSSIFREPELRGAFAQLSNTAAELERAFADASARYADPALRRAFAGLQTRVAALTTQFDTLLAVFDNSTLSRLARDSAISKALNAARVELDSVIAVTKREPLRFWFGPGEARPLGDPLRRR